MLNRGDLRKFPENPKEPDESVARSTETFEGGGGVEVGVEGSRASVRTNDNDYHDNDENG